MAKKLLDIEAHLKLIAKLEEASELVRDADKVVGTKTKEVKDGRKD